ncbi:MAG: hypothetical protein EOO02_08555 [Chitinophagaceae bacterium]|nr:MAG: hypothetical protein EOO02_08555 [Chitinophagaceae bacterium]
MRLVKLGIISLIVFAAIIYLFSLFIPSHVRISRAVNIEAPKDSVSDYIRNMNNWQHWNVMVSDQDSGNGNYSAESYTGKNLKVLMLAASVDSLNTEWQHNASDKIASGFKLIQDQGDITVVQWYFDFYLSWYPWEKFGSIVFDQQLGPSMEKSLNNLKCKLENCSQ